MTPRQESTWQIARNYLTQPWAVAHECFKRDDPPASRARFFPSFFCFLAQGGIGVTVGSPSCCQRMRRACCAWSARSQISESGSLKLRQLAQTRSTSPNTSPAIQEITRFDQSGHTYHTQTDYSPHWGLHQVYICKYLTLNMPQPDPACKHI